MKIKRPKGITGLSLYLLVSSLLSIRYLFNPETKIIVANHVLTGLAVDIHYTVTIVLGIAIAIGLWMLKKWAALLFVFENIFFFLFIFVNAIFVRKETLLLAGWKDYDRLIHGYRTSQVVAVVIIILLTAWLLAYRKYFDSQNEPNHH